VSGQLSVSGGHTIPILPGNRLKWGFRPRSLDAVRRFDDEVTRSKRKPESESKRLSRAEAYARAQEAQHRLDELVTEELTKAGIESGSTVAFRLRLYARKLWGVLRAPRRKLKRKQEELDRWAAVVGLASRPILFALSARVTELGAEPGLDRNWLRQVPCLAPACQGAGRPACCSRAAVGSDDCGMRCHVRRGTIPLTMTLRSGQ